MATKQNAIDRSKSHKIGKYITKGKNWAKKTIKTAKSYDVVNRVCNVHMSCSREKHFFFSFNRILFLLFSFWRRKRNEANIYTKKEIKAKERNDEIYISLSIYSKKKKRVSFLTCFIRTHAYYTHRKTENTTSLTLNRLLYSSPCLCCVARERNGREQKLLSTLQIL